MTSPFMASVVKLEPSVWVQELDGVLKVKKFLGISLISGRKSEGGEYIMSSPWSYGSYP